MNPGATQPGVPDPELAAAIALDRAVRLRGGRSRTIDAGFVVLCDRLPAVRFLNSLLLRAPLPPALDAPAVLALAERWLGHLGQRTIVFEDSAAGERLAPALMAGGGERRSTLLMVHRGAAAPRPGDDRGREIADAELRALQLANYAEADLVGSAPAGLAQMLVQAQAALRAGTAARCFGAGDDGELSSMCTLFMDPDCEGRRAALVEEVATLTAARERGLARAVVSRALAAARDWGAELIAVPCDADDWPRLLYAALGFEAVGTILTLTLPGGSAPAPV